MSSWHSDMVSFGYQSFAAVPSCLWNHALALRRSGKKYWDLNVVFNRLSRHVTAVAKLVAKRDHISMSNIYALVLKHSVLFWHTWNGNCWTVAICIAFRFVYLPNHVLFVTSACGELRILTSVLTACILGKGALFVAPTVDDCLAKLMDSSTQHCKRLYPFTAFM